MSEIVCDGFTDDVPLPVSVPEVTVDPLALNLAAVADATGYDSGDAEQSGSRDAELDLAPNGCPHAAP